MQTSRIARAAELHWECGRTQEARHVAVFGSNESDDHVAQLPVDMGVGERHGALVQAARVTSAGRK